MKKLISWVLVLAMAVCLFSTVASAELATGISMESALSGYVGDYLWLQPMAEGGWEWPASLVWTSSDPAVATVDGNDWGCDVALLAGGTTTVTVTSGSLSASCVVTVSVPEELTLNADKAVSLGDYESTRFTFTTTEAGKYTIYVPTATGHISGEVNSLSSYSSFESDAENIYTTAVVELAAGESCNVSAYCFDAVDFTLKVIKTPALNSYKLDKELLELNYIEGYSINGNVTITADPITAELGEIIWEVKDTAVADVVYAYAGTCYVESRGVGSTVLEASVGGSVIATVDVVVKDAMAEAEEIVWGVTYDLPCGYTVFTFTPDKTDTYTFKSATTDDETDPCLDVITEGDYGLNSVLYTDDVNGLNFEDSVELTAGTKYYLILSTYNEGNTTYSFTMKGTDVSDPGYDLKKVDAKDATCTEEGNTAYYECQKTGIKFADENATRLAGEVVIKKLDHKLEKVAATKTTVAHEKCSECGALFVDGKEVTSVDNPKTGDNTLVLPMVMLAVLSISGLAVTVIGKKKAI